jgi:hypothetical protein
VDELKNMKTMCMFDKILFFFSFKYPFRMLGNYPIYLEIKMNIVYNICCLVGGYIHIGLASGHASGMAIPHLGRQLRHGRDSFVVSFVK